MRLRARPGRRKSVRLTGGGQLRCGSLHISISYIRRMKASVDLEVSTDAAPPAHITGEKRSLSGIRYTEMMELSCSVGQIYYTRGSIYIIV